MLVELLARKQHQLEHFVITYNTKRMGSIDLSKNTAQLVDSSRVLTRPDNGRWISGFCFTLDPLIR